MPMQTGVEQVRSAHVIVLGNEKGGSGKSTTAMHLAVALMNAGQRVATVDLDSRQKSLTHYVENRRNWAGRAGIALSVPEHCCIARGSNVRLDENEREEFAGFAEAVAAVEAICDFIVVDTPGNDSYLMRLAHLVADTLITPLNDSFIDFDVLATLDPETFAVTGDSHYTEMVRDARRHRRQLDGRAIDWIVVRNRLAMPGARSRGRVGESLDALGRQVGFRWIDGFSERAVYREFFPRGLTAFDEIDEQTLGTRPSLAHVTARQEVMALLEALRLPIDDRGRRRAAARAEWFAAADRPLEMDDVLV